MGQQHSLKDQLKGLNWTGYLVEQHGDGEVQEKKKKKKKIKPFSHDDTKWCIYIYI